MNKVVVDSSHTSSYSSRKATAKEWRLFMSARISETLSTGDAKRNSSRNDEANHEKEEFDNIFKEVQQLGISQMDWKRRKEIDMQRRVSLGAKPQKSHRMPINMGLNIKRKREEHENEKRQEDILLGRRSSKKGKAAEERSRSSARGLKASEGLFKDGVLHVKPLAAATEHRTRDSLQQSDQKKRKKPHKNKRKKKGKKKRK